MDSSRFLVDSEFEADIDFPGKFLVDSDIEAGIDKTKDFESIMTFCSHW